MLRYFVVLLSITICVAQVPTFEVASIRTHEGRPGSMMTMTQSGPRIKLDGYLITMLLMDAFDLRQEQVVLPAAFSSLNETFYDIAAKAEGDRTPTKADYRHMLQSLLRDRFMLQFHREKRPFPIYALVVGKGGPKFERTSPDKERGALISVKQSNQILKQTHATMDDLANSIGNIWFVDRMVVNRTGLTGEYDIELDATPETWLNRPDATISVFTAIQEQLGLKLDPQPADLDVLIVDHIEKPSEN